MKRVLNYALIFLLLIFNPGWSTVINIPDDYSAIQQGIYSSTDGDTVLVQPGTYGENIDFLGRSIVVGSLFLTTGDTSHISSTIIDGGGYGSVVTMESGEDSTAVLIGFTIQNGWWGGGGGVYCYESDPIITNNIITANGCLRQGAGIYCVDSDAIIRGNIIIGNASDYGGYGGGIYILGVGATPYVGYNYIRANVSSYGGGIFCAHATPLITNNLIVEDTAYNSGGGIQFWNTDAVFTNNTVYGNSAFNSGGGMYFHSSDAQVTNTICWNDYAPGSFEIYCDEQSSPVISYCDIQDSVWTGTGNIDIDPLFRDPTGGDFHLMSIACGDSADSPCIDAGHPDSVDNVLDCLFGLGGPRADMGAYGGNNGDWPTSIMDDDQIENMNLPVDICLLQNYPNPFNASTTIRFISPEPQDVKLTIYDLLGRRIETLLDEYKQAGVRTITFDASHLSSGVYFYRLQAGETIETKRMVLIK